MKKARKMRNIGFLLLLCLLFTACGNESSQGASATPTTAPTQSVAPSATAEPTATLTSTETLVPTVEPTTEPTQNTALSPTPIIWPEELSLYEAYEDDFYIGTIYTDQVRTGKLLDIVSTHFNIITPENLMKPENMQPTEGNFNFTSANSMMDYADILEIAVHGHTLAWHQQSGRWLGKNVDRETAIEQLRSHITNIVSEYKGRIYSWDVVNEAINDGVKLPADGDWTKCLRETQWLTSIGPDYLELAFQFAHEADPDCMLYYNDYNLNSKNKADIAYAMVADFLERGIPIHGIGMQGHYSTDLSLGSVEYSLNLFSQLGIAISVTELDIGVNDASGQMALTEEQEREQAITYAKLFKLYKKYADVIERVTFWGHVDSYSWRSDRFPCLFNANYTPKEALYAVYDPILYLSQYGEDTVSEVRSATAKYGTPEIDGVIDDAWSKASTNYVITPITAWEGATGRLRLLWDEAYLYVLFEVTDGVLNASAQSLHEQDSVEIFLDQKNDKAAFYGGDDGQYRVNYRGAESFGSVPENYTEFKSAAAETKDGYLIEMAIPLLEAPAAGTVMGFDAQINDSNASGIRQVVVKFNDMTDNSYMTTESFGTVILEQ